VAGVGVTITVFSFHKISFNQKFGVKKT